MRRLRFPIRDRVGKELWRNRFHWRVNKKMRNGFEYIHWVVQFTIEGWEWGIELAPENGNDWHNSSYATMWLHNYDPNQFLVGLHLYTEQDLLRWLDAFKLEYLLVDESELEESKGVRDDAKKSESAAAARSGG